MVFLKYRCRLMDVWAVLAFVALALWLAGLHYVSPELKEAYVEVVGKVVLGVIFVAGFLVMATSLTRAVHHHRHPDEEAH